MAPACSADRCSHFIRITCRQRPSTACVSRCANPASGACRPRSERRASQSLPSHHRMRGTACRRVSDARPNHRRHDRPLHPMRRRVLARALVAAGPQFRDGHLLAVRICGPASVDAGLRRIPARSAGGADPRAKRNHRYHTPVIIGIVGAEAAKFTEAGEAAARKIIRELLSVPRVVACVSGGCHLGGADIYAEEEAKRLGIPIRVHKPAQRSWNEGYKPRNILIAQDADVLYNFVVDVLPEGYRGMRFPGCYHCGTTDHVKSGGCWTAKYAAQLGKEVYWTRIHNQNP